MKKVLMVLVLILFAGSAFAQTDSLNIRLANLKWNSYEFLDSAKGSYIEHDSYFLTHGEGSIDWHQQKDGEEKVTTFSITQIEGSWPDITVSGSITYSVMLNEVNGKIIFQRDGDWITAKLVFNNAAVGNLNYVFTISSFENL